MKARPFRSWLTALGLLAVALLNFPLLGTVRGEWFGIPAGYLYLFGIWLLLIVLVALVSETRK